MTCLCVEVSDFWSFDIVIICLARECITMVRCVAYIHELHKTLTCDLFIKIIFSPWIWVKMSLLQIWYMGVSLWDNMLCTFLTIVWPWPLTYIWVAREFKGTFYHWRYYWYYIAFSLHVWATIIHSLKRYKYTRMLLLTKQYTMPPSRAMFNSKWNGLR